MELKEYRFGEVTINFDKKRVPLSGAQREKRQGNFRYYGAQGVIDHIDDFIFDGTYLLIAEDGENLKSKKQNIAQVVDGQFWVNNHAHIVQGNELCNTRYLCYLLNSMDLSGYITGSAQPKLSQANLNTVTLFLPDIAVQERIVEWLYLFDKKIEVNKQINDNLEKLLVFMYEDMKKNHTDWTNVTLEQFCNIFTGKKNANQYNENGLYKFFTCGEKVLRINSYIFDGPAIIISGNGSYTGRTLFYNGKFDLYQRTYACTLKPNIPNSYIYGLYIILKVALHKKINGGTHGSSIPYIVMNDIAKFEFKLNDELFKIFSIYAKNILTLIQQNNFESQKLSDIRNELLIKLINNDISISDIDL